MALNNLTDGNSSFLYNQNHKVIFCHTSFFPGIFNITFQSAKRGIKVRILAGRITAGPDNGLRLAGNLYYGNVLYKDRLSMLGGEIRYTNGSFFAESEYIRGNWTDTLSVRVHDDGLSAGS